MYFLILIKSNIFRFNDKIFYSVKVKKIEIDSEIKKFKNKKDVDNLSGNTPKFGNKNQ